MAVYQNLSQKCSLKQPLFATLQTILSTCGMGEKVSVYNVFFFKTRKYVILMIKDLRNKMIYYREWYGGSVAK